MLKLRSSRKAQFFIISMIIIIAILAGIQVIFAGYNDIDLSKPFLAQEFFWFQEIKEQVIRAVKTRSCPELSADFIEIKLMTEDYLARKGVEFTIENTTPICIGTTKYSPIEIEMNLTSRGIKLYDKFTVS